MRKGYKTFTGRANSKRLGNSPSPVYKQSENELIQSIAISYFNSFIEVVPLMFIVTD